jgi:hypothetical protein
MSPLSLSQEPFDGELMSRLRILLLAPDANPEAISLALEGYSNGEALAQLHTVTLVAR